MSNNAWVTLATNDSYSLGALVVANSLKKVNTLHQTAVLITPGVSESMKSKLEATFNVVVEVNVLDSKDAANLALLSRPELGITFTKLHCWRLTQYEKCVFLDADTFVLQNCDELFDREELSAAPDVGWPDCFNSGVFVFRPSLDTFGKLIEFATKQGSFDGGDQGLLNSFFSDWAQKDISKHLPFIYNTCSTACYSYLPAFKQFGQNVKILHFIGQVKPWLLNFDSSSKTAYAPQGYGHLGEYLQQWWNVFCADVHPALTSEMTTSAHEQYSHETQEHQNTILPNPPSVPSYPNPPRIEFIDPWDSYYQASAIPTESESHDFPIDVNNVEKHIEPSVPCIDQNHESFPIPQTIVEDHQYNHTENAHDERPISIPSSSHNDINVLSHSHQTCNEVEDSSIHSININSYQTVNHDHSHASTAYDSATGNDVPKVGEQDEGSYQNDGNIGDVNVDEKPIDTYEEGGLAGALAQLTLGSPRSAEQQAYEEGIRRQCWESGNIDYLGKDSFDNIWKRITKTIETKNDPPAIEKNRSPTPQPEELAVEEKKEVKVGPTFNESEEDVLAETPIHEQTITEVSPDGTIIEKKIVTYPGEVTTEIEEIEEVDGQIMSVKRSVVGTEKQPVQPKPKTLAEIKNEPIVLVPGYRTVEIDEKTNSTTVTEKTTTGYQQTITTIQEDGTKKIQTKTFYDPVEVPGEEEEEETYEETETFEPGTTTTTTTTTAEGASDAVDCAVSKKEAEVEITDVPSKVEEPSGSSLLKQEESTSVVKKDETEQESKSLTDLKNQPIVIVPGHQKVEFDKETNTTTVTEKTTTGYQQTISTVTADGRTIVQTKVFYDPIPSEHVEEETTTTTTTTVTAIPSEYVEEEETTTTTVTEVLDSATSAENISETQQSTVTQEQPKDTSVSTIDVKDLQVALSAPAGPTSLTQKKTTADGKEIEVTTTVSQDGLTKTLRKTTRKPSEEIEIEEYEEVEIEEPGEVKVITTTKTMPIVEALEDAAKDIVVETAPQKQVKPDTKVSAKQTAIEAKQTTSEVKPSEVKPSEVKPSEVKPSEVKPSEVKPSEVKPTPASKKTTTETTTEVKETTTKTKQTATEAKQSSTQSQGAIEPKSIKTEPKPSPTGTTVKKLTTGAKTNEKDSKATTPASKTTATSKKDESATKSKTTTTTTDVVKKDSPVKSVKTSTVTSAETEIVGKPKVTTKDGETTTEVVRRIPGGTEHITTTVKADGTTKTESRKVFDVVELSSSEEEYEEVIEDVTPPKKTTTTKVKGPGAVGVKAGPKTPTVTEATPPNTPPLKPLVIGATSSELKAEHEIPDTPPLDKVEQLRKKKLQSAPASKVVQKVDKAATGPTTPASKLAQKVDKPAAEATAPASKLAPKVDKAAVEAPKAPPRKKEVKKPATGN